ncbi:hypothetical protein [Escherichia coli]
MRTFLSKLAQSSIKAMF